MSKKLLLPVFCLIFALTACSVMDVYSDDSRIASISNSYNLTNYSQEQSEHRIEGTVGKFHGMDTIWSFDSEEDTEVSMTYRIDLQEGKLKLALIAPDGTVSVIDEFTDPGDGSEQEVKVSIKKGLNRIKMVGQEAAFEWHIEMEQGKFGELGMDSD